MGVIRFQPQRRDRRREDTGAETSAQIAFQRFTAARSCVYSPHVKLNEITREIIGAAIEVHRELGPGKAEAAYEHALAHELGLRGLSHRVQVPVPVVYKGVKLECGYRLDLLVVNGVVVEIKSVEFLSPIHRAQVLTYLKLGGWKLSLLLNFSVAVLKDGIERIVLGFEEGKETAETRWTRRKNTLTVNATPSFHCATDSGDTETERLAREVIASAKETHRELGPGLLPSAYEICLCHELRLRGVPFARKQPLALSYKGVPLPEPDEIDLLVGERVVVSPRALMEVQPVHETELLSQLRLGGWKLGLLINFNTINFAEGVRRLVRSDKALKKSAG
jgi:GxxExxY protein